MKITILKIFPSSQKFGLVTKSLNDIRYEKEIGIMTPKLTMTMTRTGSENSRRKWMGKTKLDRPIL
ncbi:MAG TPA: hypothetical protein VH796_07870 [Nitrososphaeraceae archaeon]